MFQNLRLPSNKTQTILLGVLTVGALGLAAFELGFVGSNEPYSSTNEFADQGFNDADFISQTDQANRDLTKFDVQGDKLAIDPVTGDIIRDKLKEDSVIYAENGSVHYSYKLSYKEKDVDSDALVTKEFNGCAILENKKGEVKRFQNFLLNKNVLVRNPIDLTLEIKNDCDKNYPSITFS